MLLTFLVNLLELFFKDAKGWTIVNGFQKVLDKSDRKPNKIW